jgi:hypothetical protein
MAKGVKCPICEEYLPKEEAIPYRNRYYHRECFEASYSEDEVDKTYFNLTFKKVVGRIPTTQEWVQANQLIDNEGWTWNKIEDVFYYTYVIEDRQVNNEYGAIGLLPYMELRAKAFYEKKWKASDYEPVEQKDVVVYGKQIVKERKPKETKDIDRLVGSEDLWD